MDEAKRIVRATTVVEIEVFSEGSTDEELAELLMRCATEGDSPTSVGLKAALTAYVEGKKDKRIGYSADGNKDAYLGDNLEATVVNVEILPIGS